MMTSFLRSQQFEGTYDSLGGVKTLPATQREESGRHDRALVFFGVAAEHAIRYIASMLDSWEHDDDIHVHGRKLSYYRALMQSAA